MAPKLFGVDVTNNCIALYVFRLSAASYLYSSLKSSFLWVYTTSIDFSVEYHKLSKFKKPEMKYRHFLGSQYYESVSFFKRAFNLDHGKD